VQVIRTLAEVSTIETLTFLSDIVKDSLNQTKEFWAQPGVDSKLMPLLDLVSADEEQANNQFHKLAVLHTRVTLLSEVYATAGFGHPRPSIVLLQPLMGRGGADIIPDLGALHRACVWENIVFKADLASRGVPSETDSPFDVLTSAEESADGATNGSAAVSSTATPQPGATANGDANNGTGPSATSTPGAIDGSASPAAKEETLRQKNAKALKHLVTQMPTAIGPFFQGKRHVLP
jgi:E3 ubiquitin-protein ligase HUWE1